MRLIKPSFEIIEQEPGLDGLYKHIERCGRLSYKSEDKITEESAKPFVDRMVNSKHGAVLEHGTVYLEIKSRDRENFSPFFDRYSKNLYSRISIDKGIVWHTLYIVTNYRVLVENGWLDDLKYLCEPIECHEPRISVKFTCSRSISHELVRHRVFSFIQESQRYVNYSKGRYGGEITYIIPIKLEIPECSVNDNTTNFEVLLLSNKIKDGFLWLKSLYEAEQSYLKLIESGWKPQEAREVLPNATKTEIIMTGFLSDWVGDIEKKKGFFPLRCDSTAHPDMRALAIPLREEFIKRGWIND